MFPCGCKSIYPPFCTCDCGYIDQLYTLECDILCLYYYYGKSDLMIELLSMLVDYRLS